MHAISLSIEKSKKQFLTHPFFHFLNNDDLPVEQRLRFLPRLSHFVMSFSDINKYILPFNSPDSFLEQAVNRHAEEDAGHWQWFLNDLDKTGFNKQAPFTEHLEYLWSESMQNSRKLSYDLIALLANQPAKMRLVMIEVMEATGNAMFDTLSRIAANLNPPLEYCGTLHLSHETGHTIGSEEAFIDGVTFSSSEREQAEHIIKAGFRSFENFFTELLVSGNSSH